MHFLKELCFLDHPYPELIVFEHVLLPCHVLCHTFNSTLKCYLILNVLTNSRGPFLGNIGARKLASIYEDPTE
jgi:hypothetical protein